MNPKTETPTESQTSTDTKPAVTKPAKAQSTPSTPEPVLKATESLVVSQFKSKGYIGLVSHSIVALMVTD